MEKLIISGSCTIRDGKIFLNKEVLFHDESTVAFADFIKNAYRFLNTSYPKFFKMDQLSKLGFLAADILFKKYFDEKSMMPEETGIVLANSSSSLDTDFTYFDSIKDSANYFPSPSVFVYTLPNIMIGEICIRHKITGEGVFFVSEKFDPDFMCKYVTDLFGIGKVQRCLTGWVELLDDRYDAALYFIEKSEIQTAESINFDTRNLLDIYLNNK
jgi:hypothetical protein